MRNIIIIIFLLLLFLLSACDSIKERRSINNLEEDTVIESDDKDAKVDDYLYDSYPDVMFGGDEPVVNIFPQIPIIYVKSHLHDGYDVYVLYEVEADDNRYNKEDFLYIGDVNETSETFSTKNINFKSNYITVGTKIYRINAKSLYIEYIYDNTEYRAVGEMMVVNTPPPCVFLEGRLYVTSYNEDDSDKQNKDDLEHIGSIIANTADSNPIRGKRLVPDEELVAFGLPVGTEIYRYDEEKIYIEFPSENIYLIGESEHN